MAGVQTCALPISFKRPYHGVAGTPTQLVDALAAYKELGVQHCIVQMTAERDPDAVRLFGEKVIPALV